MNEENERLARRWFQEVWNERSIGTIEELTPPDLIGHHEMATTRSRDDFKRFHGELLALIPNVKAVVEDVLAGDTDVVVRWRFSGTAGGSGEPVSFAGMTWLKVREGQFVEGWDCWNPAPVLAIR
jgi:hypothetical protein